MARISIPMFSTDIWCRTVTTSYPAGEKRSEYMQVMCDLNILAFQTDTTRVSTCIGSTPNWASYPELGFNDQHHSNTHHNNEPEKVRKIARITEFNIAQFAYMVKKMHGLREAGGTLLDNCIMMWGSGLEDGNKHTRENLPFVIAGKGGGSIKTGRFLADVKGNQGDLLTTLLACDGIPNRSAGWDCDEATRGNQGLERRRCGGIPKPCIGVVIPPSTPRRSYSGHGP